ncbi:MAG: nucleotidyltransferase domain-containing protein [Alkalispirochaeta sp.]
MPLSRHHIDTNDVPRVFDPDQLGSVLESELRDVTFAYLHGSAAQNGVVAPHSDLDIALFLEPAILDVPSPGPTAELYETVERLTGRLVPGVRCDIGILNNAEPVYRFEVLKGRILFCRDQERWLHFYSVTCREYESQMYHYEKQHRYRVEAIV